MEENSDLADLTGPNSWALFNVLDVGSDWLQISCELCSEDQAYQEAAAFVKIAKVRTMWRNEESK